MSVTKNTIFHVPNISVINTANTEMELNVSHHIIVFFGFHLSAKVPPINEKIKNLHNDLNLLNEKWEDLTNILLEN